MVTNIVWSSQNFSGEEFILWTFSGKSAIDDKTSSG